MNNCTICHGANRAATNVFPSLLNPGARITPQKADSVLKKGEGQMHSYPNFAAKVKKSLIDFLFDKNKQKPVLKKQKKQAR